MPYLFFHNWLISLCKMSTRLTRIVVCLRISFLFDPIVCICPMLLSYSSGNICFFWFLWITLLWKWMSIYLFKVQLSIILFIPRGGNVDSYGHPGITRQNINRFLIFFKNSHTVFFRDCHYFTFSEAMPTFSTCLQVLAIFYFLDIGHLKGCEVNYTMGRQVPLLLTFFF